MKEEKTIMPENTNDDREYCEAVPGPAIVLSREEYEKIKNAPRNKYLDEIKNNKALKQFQSKIIDKTKQKDDDFCK